MGSVERPKKKVQLWKKAIVHFCLCFVMGFFSGFAPNAGRASSSILILRPPSPSPPIEARHLAAPANRSLISETQQPQVKDEEEDHEEQMENTKTEESEEPGPGTRPGSELSPEKQLIIVTPTRAGDGFLGVWLRRLAATIRLVRAPVLWVVVERALEPGSGTGSGEVSEVLRKTGVMYRHLVYRENFTEAEAEMDHQRNVALRHIKQHRLTGIVHFAGLSNVYDLDFFHELRQIEVFGTWPIALLSPNGDNVITEGPICNKTQVMGWHLKKMNNETDSELRSTSRASRSTARSYGTRRDGADLPRLRHLLRRKPRPIQTQEVTNTTTNKETPISMSNPKIFFIQDSVKFIKEMDNEDETSLKEVSIGKCSRILMWHLPSRSAKVLLPVRDSNDHSNLRSETQR